MVPDSHECPAAKEIRQDGGHANGQSRRAARARKHGAFADITGNLTNLRPA